MKLILTIGLYLLIFISASGQSSNEGNLEVGQMIFKSIMGHQKSDSVNDVFCLLGRGYFRTPTSKNIDSLIVGWIKKHSKARIFKVSSFGPTMLDNPTSKMIYCLIIDGKDTLNNYLVRNGAVPGGTMERPTTTVSRKDRKFLKEIKQSPSKINYFMDKKSYNRFIRQIIAQEKLARDGRLGIWKED